MLAAGKRVSGWCHVMLSKTPRNDVKPPGKNLPEKVAQRNCTPVAVTDFLNRTRLTEVTPTLASGKDQDFKE